MTHSVFLTNNPNLCSTSRILQSWLQLGRGNGLQGAVIGQRDGDLIGWLRQNEFRCQTNPMPWPNRWRPWKCGWHALRAARWARGVGAEVIHCNEHDIYPFAAVLKRFYNRPLVCHVRFQLSRPFSEWAFGGRRAPDALLWTSHQQKADSADAIAGLVPDDRQHVLRLGIDLQHFGNAAESGRALRREWGIGDDEILVGIPSPLRPRKRVEDFIAIIRRLAAKHEKLVGVIAGGEIAGDEDYRQRIEREVAESGLGRRLRWVGYLEPVEPFHHACDVSVSTSGYETFGNSVCEAMACGKPVAGYVGGSVAEVVGDTGLIVETGDLDGLTAAVERLVVDSELRRELGAKARQRVAVEFNPANSLKQLEEIYRSLLNGKK
jgi:glycosyltransferase involved in cell wall biosynthesis